ncbi:hypothetical protein [Streptomyces sp. NPDC005486]|uniref:hypothetical protein n=1 Tax=Streptomyces sp. NPDC005486 TaxID=3155345 RepID=UPI0033BEA8ED
MRRPACPDAEFARERAARRHPDHDEEAPATHGAPHVPTPGKGAVHGGRHGRRRAAMRRTAVAATPAGAAVTVGRRMSR